MKTEAILRHIQQTCAEEKMTRLVCGGLNPYGYQAYPVLGNYVVENEMLYFQFWDPASKTMKSLDTNDLMEHSPQLLIKAMMSPDDHMYLFTRHSYNTLDILRIQAPLPFQKGSCPIKEELHIIPYGSYLPESEYVARMEAFRLFLSYAKIESIQNLHWALGLTDEQLLRFPQPTRYAYEYEYLSPEEWTDLVMGENYN